MNKLKNRINNKKKNIRISMISQQAKMINMKLNISITISMSNSRLFSVRKYNHRIRSKRNMKVGNKKKRC